MDTLLFTIASKLVIGIHLTKEGKNIYNENFKPLKDEVKKHTRR